MKKMTSMLVCMIVCLAASQALAAYNFSTTKNDQMFNDMKTWTAAQWDENIHALLDTGDVGLITRCLTIAEKAIGESKVPGITSDLLAKIIGDNAPNVGDRLGGAAPASLNDVTSGDGAVSNRNSNLSKTSVQEFLKNHPEYADKYAGDLIEGEPVPPKPISKGATK